LPNHEFESINLGCKICSEKSAGKKWETGFYLHSKLPKTVQDPEGSENVHELCAQSAKPDEHHVVQKA
jgi:hypothetical protein